MADTITTVATDSAGQIVAEVAAALKDAVKEYGPDAVDLALMAYRVDAIQTIANGMILTAVGAAFAVVALFFGRKFKAEMEKDGYETYEVFYGFAGGGALLGSVPFFVEGPSRLVVVYNWIAAFGYPELMIATKALQAAGLL